VSRILCAQVSGCGSPWAQLSSGVGISIGSRALYMALVTGLGLNLPGNVARCQFGDDVAGGKGVRR
jgi:hypothetical protein